MVADNVVYDRIFYGCVFFWVYSTLKGRAIIRKLESDGVFKAIEDEIGKENIEKIKVKVIKK